MQSNQSALPKENSSYIRGLRPRAIESTTNAPLQILSADWRILFANDAFARGAGRPLPAIIGSSLGECFPGAFETEFFSMLEKCMKGRTSARHTGNLPGVSEGTEYHSEVHPYQDGLVVFSVQTERTQSPQVEDYRLATMGKMAIGVAYQVKSVLNSVGLIKDVMKRRWRANAPSGDLFEQMERALTQGADLAERLAAFNRGAMPGTGATPTSVNQAAKNAIEICQPAVISRAGPVTISLGLEATRDLRIPPAPLEASIMELLLNAIELAPPNGQIAVRTGSADGRVWIEVKDDGPGMTPEVEQRAFEPFFTTKNAGAAGLGLWMVQEFIREHGGKVSLQTAPGKGTLVRLELPTTSGAAPW